MQTLKNPQKQIPNGFFFRQPEIRWDSRKTIGLHPSLDTLTRAVISARKANPGQLAQHRWSTEFEVVKAQVMQFQVDVCRSMGWTDYITDTGGSAPPFSKAQSLLNQKQVAAAVEKVKRLWAGVRTLNAWLDSGEPPVPTEQSESRAATCAECNLNGEGDFTSWFTVPASGAIKRQLERLQDRKISTSKDAKLNVCTACLCPLKVKVHTPLRFIKADLADGVLDELKAGKNCWILAEMGT